MIGFATLDETRRLGSPVVRLFRLGVGHDPDPVSLDCYADRLRQGARLLDLAMNLAGSDAFLALHGPVTTIDRPFLDFIRRQVPGLVIDPDQPAASRTELLAVLAASADAARCIPLLPGLAPGAPPDNPVAYALWIAEYDSPTEADLAAVPALDGPVVTLVMAARDSDMDEAVRTLRSLQAQLYPRWELILATSPLSPWPRRTLLALAGEDERVRLAEMKQHGSAAWLLGEGLKLRQGEWTGLLAPGDTLARSALHEMIAARHDHPAARLLFSDEDQCREGVRQAPCFKPALSPDAMLVGDAIGQLALFETGLIDEIGGLRPQTWPHHAYDLAFRAAAAIGPAQAWHIPAILFHRPAPPRNWPVAPAALPRSLPGLRDIEPAAWPRPHFAQPAPPPLVSVILPTRDHAALLATATEGLLEQTAYRHLELLVVDNGSTEPEALDLLSRLAEDRRVRILRRPGAFNFAFLCNSAATAAQGEVLLLLNNDVEIIHPEWLMEMVCHAVRPEIGAVGAKLLYPDGTIQHAGVLLGPEGAATHVGRHAARDEPFYLGQLACTRDLGAVTGACLAIRAATFRAVGGMDERLAVAWNDIDLCLRVRRAGLRVIWTPNAVLTHRESVSRGLESADPARQARFLQEQTHVRQIWGNALDDDPFLNANLLAEPSGRLSLTRPRSRRPWQPSS